MTREEVIEQLYDAKSGYKEYLSNDALDMAISALENPEKNVVAVVPCGDAINRQEAIDTIRQLYIDLATQKYVIDLLKVLPSVTPQEPIDYKTQYENYLKKSEVVISQLRAERDRLQDAFDKIRAEIEQAEFILNKSPNLQDDRTDTEKCADWSKMFKMLVINIIDKYKVESEVEDGNES